MVFTPFIYEVRLRYDAFDKKRKELFTYNRSIRALDIHAVRHKLEVELKKLNDSDTTRTIHVAQAVRISPNGKERVLKFTPRKERTPWQRAA